MIRSDVTVSRNEDLKMSVRLPEQVQIMYGIEYHGSTPGRLSTTVRPQDILCNDIVFPGEFNPHNVTPWLITIGSIYPFHKIVWASCEQDALDEAADNSMLDCIALSDKDADERVVHEAHCLDHAKCLDYGDIENDHCNSWDNFARLGNAGEPFDLDNVHIEKLDLDFQSKQFMMLLAEARGAGAGRLSEL